MSAERTPRTESAAMLLLGHLAWVGWFWAGLLALWGVALVVASRVSTIDASIWEGTVVNWHRWIIFAAGVTSVPVFLKLYVGNGGTRRLLARDVLVVGPILAAMAALYLAAGYGLEGLIYGWAGWGGAAGAGAVAERVAAEGLVFLVAHHAGWVVGAVWVRPQAAAAWVAVPLMVLAMALVGGVADGGTMRDALEAVWNPAPLLSWLVAAAITAVIAVIGSRVTREVELRC